MKNIVDLKKCALFALVMLSSCSKEEVASPGIKSDLISVSAEIGGTNNSNLRYAGSIASTSFANEDAIGVFLDAENTPVKWTYNGSNWSSASIVYWPDKENNHQFKAFYPYASASDQTAVPMPSLASQEGNFDNLGKYDFLVATKEQSCATSSTVTFTSENAFKHVSALVELKIKGTEDLKNATLNSVKLSGAGIASASTYSFASNQVTAGGESAVNDVVLSNLSHAMNGTDAVLYLVANPVTSGKLSLEIAYSNNGTNYKATLTDINPANLQGSKKSTLSLNIKENKITLSGNEITDWGEGGSLGDVTIGGDVQL